VIYARAYVDCCYAHFVTHQSYTKAGMSKEAFKFRDGKPLGECIITDTNSCIETLFTSSGEVVLKIQVKRFEDH
jgi:hypothetical protein